MHKKCIKKFQKNSKKIPKNSKKNSKKIPFLVKMGNYCIR